MTHGHWRKHFGVLSYNTMFIIAESIEDCLAGTWDSTLNEWKSWSACN